MVKEAEPEKHAVIEDIEKQDVIEDILYELEKKNKLNDSGNLLIDTNSYHHGFATANQSHISATPLWPRESDSNGSRVQGPFSAS